MPTCPIDDKDWSRCFLGLAPQANDAQRLAEYAATHAPQDTHRLAACDLHLTLAFFGRIPRDAGHALVDTLPTLRAPPLRLAMTQLAMWPDEHKPRVLVMEFARSPELQALLAQVHDAMRTLGLPIEQRPFRAHVTLARFAYRRTTSAGIRPTDQQPPELSCCFDTLALYTSVSPPPTHRYRRIAQSPLAAHAR